MLYEIKKVQTKSVYFLRVLNCFLEFSVVNVRKIHRIGFIYFVLEIQPNLILHSQNFLCKQDLIQV